VKLCPTNALYWSEGKVGITKELCVWCAACVLCCVVDDCIRLTRTRSDGKRETFSTPKQVLALLESINRRKSAQAAINRILGAPRSKSS
jgi:Fe-S-cluster-containing hydrogenase component 2